MRLLPKSEINKRVNDEKKAAIDAGAFIARKVDALREEMLTLQKERDEFISGSQKVINDSLTNLLQKKDILEKEVRDLESIVERKKKLLSDLIKQNDGDDDSTL